MWFYIYIIYNMTWWTAQRLRVQILKTPSEFKICIWHKERMLHLWTSLERDLTSQIWFIKTSLTLHSELHPRQNISVEPEILKILMCEKSTIEVFRLQIPSLLVNRCLQNAIDQQYMYSSQVPRGRDGARGEGERALPLSYSSILLFSLNSILLQPRY